MVKSSCQRLLSIASFVILLFPLTVFNFFSIDTLLSKIIFIASAGVAGLIFILADKGAVKVNLTVPILLLLLYMWQILKGVPVNSTGVIVLLCCICLSIVFSNRKKLLFIEKTLPYIIAAMLAIETILFLFPLPGSNKAFAPNNSLFSVLFSVQLSFILPAFYKIIPGRIFFRVAILLLAATLAILLLLKTGGRSGILALAGSACIYLWSKLGARKNLLKIAASLCVTTVFAVLFFYKLNSSKGRLMVYKIIFKEATPLEWFTGIDSVSLKPSTTNGSPHILRKTLLKSQM